MNLQDAVHHVAVQQHIGFTHQVVLRNGEQEVEYKKIYMMSAEQRIVDDIKKFGWHIINVFGDGQGPDYSYSIGLFKSFSSPELFISGLKGDTSVVILNTIAAKIAEGNTIDAGSEYSDFFSEYHCYFDLVDKAHYEAYFGKAVWFCQGTDFPILQCVWPNKDHEYPWQAEASFNQDILFKT